MAKTPKNTEINGLHRAKKHIQRRKVINMSKFVWRKFLLKGKRTEAGSSGEVLKLLDNIRMWTISLIINIYTNVVLVAHRLP